MEKLKIGLFIDTFYPMVDGVIQVVDQYAKRLNKFCDVTVFTTKPRKGKVDNIDHPYKVERCKIIPVPGQDYDMAFPNLDKNFKKALKEAHLDIVHIHSPFAVGKVGVKYAKKHKIPVIATLHSQYKQDFQRATKSKFLSNIATSIIMKKFNACDRCFAVNSKIADVYFEEYKAKVLPGVLKNGTEFTPIENIEESLKLVNEKFTLDSQIPVLLFVGRLTDLKNIFFIAKSLKIIKDKGKKFKMIYVGTGPDEEKLKNLVKELDLEEDVIFTGRVMDRQLLKALYLRADLFLFPSFYDTDGLVKIEAASQKTPTILLEGSAASAGVTDGENGFIAKNDITAFAEKIIEILDDKNLYNKVKENCYKDLYRSWDDMVKVAYKTYLEMIEKKKSEKK